MHHAGRFRVQGCPGADPRPVACRSLWIRAGRERNGPARGRGRRAAPPARARADRPADRPDRVAAGHRRRPRRGSAADRARRHRPRAGRGAASPALSDRAGAFFEAEPEPNAGPGHRAWAGAVSLDSGEVGTRPSCTIYDGSLGNGWSVTSAGLKVLPGELVPDTRERAMRVERSRPAQPETEMALLTSSPL